MRQLACCALTLCSRRGARAVRNSLCVCVFVSCGAGRVDESLYLTGDSRRAGGEFSRGSAGSGQPRGLQHTATLLWVKSGRKVELCLIQRPQETVPGFSHFRSNGVSLSPTAWFLFSRIK